MFCLFKHSVLEIHDKGGEGVDCFQLYLSEFAQFISSRQSPLKLQTKLRMFEVVLDEEVHFHNNNNDLRCMIKMQPTLPSVFANTSICRWQNSNRPLRTQIFNFASFYKFEDVILHCHCITGCNDLHLVFGNEKEFTFIYKSCMSIHHCQHQSQHRYHGCFYPYTNIIFPLLIFAKSCLNCVDNYTSPRTTC